MATPCKQVQAPQGCRVHCISCGSDICHGDRYTQVDMGIPSNISGFNIVNNYCGNCRDKAPCSKPFCIEQPGSALHHPVGCNDCHRLILRHEPRIAWLPSEKLLEYPSPPWSYRHVTCCNPCQEGSPCSEGPLYMVKEAV